MNPDKSDHKVYRELAEAEAKYRPSWGKVSPTVVGIILIAFCGAAAVLGDRLRDALVSLHEVVLSGQPLGNVMLDRHRGTEAAIAAAESLADHWQLEGVVAGEKEWSEGELAAVDAVFGMLVEAERQALVGIKLVRGDREKPRDGVVSAGLYTGHGSDASVTIFDHAFAWCVDSPTCSRGHEVIAHEFGHAFANSRARELWATTESAQTNGAGLVDEYNGLVKQRNRLAERAVTATGAEAGDWRKQIAATDAKLRNLAARVDAMKKKWRGLYEQYQREIDSGAVMRAYNAVAKGASLTKYGETSPWESFAESFARFYVEPKELREELPDVYAWFADGGHIAALEGSGKAPSGG